MFLLRNLSCVRQLLDALPGRCCVEDVKEVAEEGSHYVFDDDCCKGCGICAHECPRGYIDMEQAR